VIKWQSYKKEGREVRAELAAGARYFYFLHSILTSPGAQPASCSVDVRDVFLGVKLAMA